MRLLTPLFYVPQ